MSYGLFVDVVMLMSKYFFVQKRWSRHWNE